MNKKIIIYIILCLFFQFFLGFSFAQELVSGIGEDNIKTLTKSGKNTFQEVCNTESQNNKILIKEEKKKEVEERFTIEMNSVNLKKEFGGNYIDNQGLSKHTINSGELGKINFNRQDRHFIDTSVSVPLNKNLSNVKIENSTISENKSLMIENQQFPELIISEVYFDGTDERVEIINTSATEDFSGDVSLVGAKASEVLLSSIQIPAGKSIVFGDKLEMLSSHDIISQTGLGLNISDTSAIDISLVFSGITLDGFHVDEQSVTSVNNKKQSFHRFLDTREIFATSGNYIQNMLNGCIANPGIIYNSTDMGGNTSGTGNSTGTGTNTTGTFVKMPKLLISELYIYDQKSYLEITNLSSSELFSGTLEFSGSLNLAQNITLSPGGQFVLYTNPSIFENINQFSGQQKELSIDYSGGIQIDMLYSGVKIDEFIVHPDRVKKISGDNSSFEKIGTGDMVNNYFTTYIGLNLDRVYNTKTPYLGNPGKIFSIAEYAKDITQSIPVNSIPNTGLQLPINCNDFRNTGQLNISEIFPGNQIYHPFIELENPGNITESYEYILISGTAISGSLRYATTDLEINKNILLTDTDSWYNEGLDALANPDFKLQNSGFIVLYGVNTDYNTLEVIDQDILDIVQYSGFREDKSLYYNGHNIQCVKIFDEEKKFSPNFDNELLEFFSVESNPSVKTVYISRGGGGCSIQREEKFETTIPKKDSEISIVGVKYITANKQKIIIKSKIDQDINMRNYSIQGLTPLQEKKLGSLTLFGREQKEIIGNFSLSQYDSCLNLLRGDEVIDRYCYTRLKKVKESDDSEDNTNNDSDDTISVEIPKLMITKIDYNPSGVDTNNEKIYFAQNISQIFTSKNLKNFNLDIYKNNQLYKTRKFSQNMVKKIGNNYIQGSFLLPNSNVFQKDIIINISYEYNNKYTIIARGKYNPHKDKIKVKKLYVPKIKKHNQKSLVNDIKAEKYNIKIQNINYNPIGNDHNNETITLLLKNESSIELDENFYLMFDTHRKKIPRNTLISGKITSITGNFQFPNSKATCVDLVYNNYVFDTYCYNPKTEKFADMGIRVFTGGLFSGQQIIGTNTGMNKSNEANILKLSKFIQDNLQIKIRALLPNPKGKDYGHEKLKLSISGNIDFLHEPYLELDSGKKVALFLEKKTGEQLIHGSLSLKNSASCVKLYNNLKIPVLMDTFCYNEVKENQRNNQHSEVLKNLSAINFDILTTAKIKKFSTKTCLIYKGEKFNCIRTPKIKHKITKSEISQEMKQQLKLYKNFTETLKTHFSENRYPFYNYDIKPYYVTLYTILDNPKQQRYTKIDHKKISSTNFQKIHMQRIKYPLDSYLEKYIYKYIPQGIKKKYYEMFELYIANKSESRKIF